MRVCTARDVPGDVDCREIIEFDRIRGDSMTSGKCRGDCGSSVRHSGTRFRPGKIPGGGAFWIYELLTARPPFEGRDRNALIQKIADDDPPALGELEPSVLPALETIVLKALRKDPADR